MLIYTDILYLQKLALTSPTSGGRSVGIVCLRAKATEFVCRCDTCPVCNVLTLIIVAQPIKAEKDSKEIGFEAEKEWSNSGQCPMVGFCEH
jgi:hypothetical protein